MKDSAAQPVEGSEAIQHLNLHSARPRFHETIADCVLKPRMRFHHQQSGTSKTDSLAHLAAKLERWVEKA